MKKHRQRIKVKCGCFSPAFCNRCNGTGWRYETKAEHDARIKS